MQCVEKRLYQTVFGSLLIGDYINLYRKLKPFSTNNTRLQACSVNLADTNNRIQLILTFIHSFHHWLIFHVVIIAGYSFNRIQPLYILKLFINTNTHSQDMKRASLF